MIVVTPQQGMNINNIQIYSIENFIQQNLSGLFIFVTSVSLFLNFSFQLNGLLQKLSLCTCSCIILGPLTKREKKTNQSGLLRAVTCTVDRNKKPSTHPQDLKVLVLFEGPHDLCVTFVPNARAGDIQFRQDGVVTQTVGERQRPLVVDSIPRGVHQLQFHVVLQSK